MICPPNKETISHATSHSNHRFSWRHAAEIAWKTASDAERVTQLLQARIELSDPDAFGMGYLQIAWCAWSQLQDQVANALTLAYERAHIPLPTLADERLNYTKEDTMQLSNPLEVLRPGTLDTSEDDEPILPPGSAAKNKWNSTSHPDRIAFLRNCGVNPRPDNPFAANWYIEMARNTWGALPQRVVFALVSCSRRTQPPPAGGHR